MLTCQQVTEVCTDYLEKRMSFGQRLSFQLHLGMCGNCRVYMRQMRATIETLGRLDDQPMPAAVQQELLARFRDWKQTTSTG
jgi:predicted anti-sigma-YlaC factor YlaD